MERSTGSKRISMSSESLSLVFLLSKEKQNNISKLQSMIWVLLLLEIQKCPETFLLKPKKIKNKKHTHAHFALLDSRNDKTTVCLIATAKTIISVIFRLTVHRVNFEKLHTFYKKKK